MGDGRWEMGDGRWEMGDGSSEMGDGRWEIPRSWIVNSGYLIIFGLCLIDPSF
jgi:hypothetical protein